MKALSKTKSNFKKAMDDDFNTSQAITNILLLVKELNKHLMQKEFSSKDARKIYELFKDSLTILLGDLFERELIMDEAKDLSKGLINLLIKVRNKAREKKDYKTSDMIRQSMEKIGIKLKDDKKKTTWELL